MGTLCLVRETNNSWQKDLACNKPREHSAVGACHATTRKIRNGPFRLLGSGYFECVVHYNGKVYRGISIDPLEATKRTFGLAGKREGADLR
jgi:hypothetical protein